MQASTQTVWFAPLWQSPDYSSVDYFDLFSPSAPWSTAASHVQIFKIYSQLLDGAWSEATSRGEKLPSQSQKASPPTVPGQQ